MTCSGAYSSSTAFASFWCIRTPLSVDQEAAINSALSLTAGRIHLARASVGACDCTLSTAATAALAELNIILAAIFHNCRCGEANLSAEQRTLWMQDAQATLKAIYEGTLEVCEGETGSEFPAMAWGEMALTEWAQADAQLNYARRNP